MPDCQSWDGGFKGIENSNDLKHGYISMDIC